MEGKYLFGVFVFLAIALVAVEQVEAGPCDWEFVSSHGEDEFCPGGPIGGTCDPSPVTQSHTDCSEYDPLAPPGATFMAHTYSCSCPCEPGYTEVCNVNACGDVGGTVQCDGICSGPEPPEVPVCANPSTVCAGDPIVSDNDCGSCPGGSLGPSCVNPSTVCSGEPISSDNDCGSCSSGSLGPVCADPSTVCAGGPIASSNDCGSCPDGTAVCASCGDSTVDVGEDCDGGNLDGGTCSSEGFDGGSLSCSSCSYDTSSCCNDECSSGGDECFGGDVYSCNTGGSCNTWSLSEVCGGGESCVSGSCVAGATCSSVGGEGCTSGVGAGEIAQGSAGELGCFAGNTCVSCDTINGYTWNSGTLDCELGATCSSVGGEGCTTGVGVGETAEGSSGALGCFAGNTCVSCQSGYIWNAVTRDCEPSGGGDPKGFFNTASCTRITAWTCDEDLYAQSLIVNVYIDSTLVFTGPAAVPAGAGVVSACGDTNLHRFFLYYADLSTDYRDNNPHTIQVLARDITDSGAPTGSWKLLKLGKDITGVIQCGPDCGDGVVGAGEQCDDGNTVDTDACNNSCQWVPSTCFVVQFDYNDDGFLDGNDAEYLAFEVIGQPCPEGKICDINGDGTLTVSDIIEYSDILSGDTECPVEGICGDGVVDDREQCDDGNNENGDLCSSTCQWEPSECYYEPYDYNDDGVIDGNDAEYLEDNLARKEKYVISTETERSPSRT